MSKRVLVIGHTHPESRTTGAGRRMLQLIEALEQTHFEYHFATTAQASPYADKLPVARVHTIQLNDPSFDVGIKKLDPQVVIFDRFMTEEQFGWRVTSECPHAVRILDTEDLHFLRKVRQDGLLKSPRKDIMFSDLAKREIASILRSDLSLIISEFEYDLLQRAFGISTDQLLYLPFWSGGQRDEVPGFDQRRDFVVLGSLLHGPNRDAVAYLSGAIWPELRSRLPQAELHIFGAYGDGKLAKYHTPEQGIHLKGWVEDLSEILPRYRVNLCAVRYGAGLKIKLFDAMEFGIPSVSTPIGAEGIADESEFPGMIAEDEPRFIRSAEQLYNDLNAWNKAGNQAKKLLNDRFSADIHSSRFVNRIEQLQNGLELHRKKNFIIEVLQHQSVQSTKYMSKWIEEKNRNKV